MRTKTETIKVTVTEGPNSEATRVSEIAVKTTTKSEKSKKAKKTKKSKAKKSKTKKSKSKKSKSKKSKSKKNASIMTMKEHFGKLVHAVKAKVTFKKDPEAKKKKMMDRILQAEAELRVLRADQAVAAARIHKAKLTRRADEEEDRARRRASLRAALARLHAACHANEDSENGQDSPRAFTI